METIKILGINGSPRPKGNSSYLLEQAMEGAKEAGSYVQTETYNIGGKGKNFAGCDSCFVCSGNGECHIKDSFQELQEKWMEADVIIYSVPVYHMTYPAQLRAFIDRLGNSSFGYYGQKICKGLKVIGSIAQGCHIFSGQEHALTDLVNHALVMGGIPVTGDMWESYIGVGGWTECDLGKNALAKQFNAGKLDAEVTVRASRVIGKRAAQIALVVKSGMMANREALEADGGYEAFFLTRRKQEAASRG